MHFLSWLCPEDALPQVCKQLMEKQILPANSFCPSHPGGLRISAGELGRRCRRPISVTPTAPGLLTDVVPSDLQVWSEQHFWACRASQRAAASSPERKCCATGTSGVGGVPKLPVWLWTTLPCGGVTAASLCSSRFCPQQSHIYGLHSAHECLNYSRINSDALRQPRVPGLCAHLGAGLSSSPQPDTPGPCPTLWCNSVPCHR